MKIIKPESLIESLLADFGAVVLSYNDKNSLMHILESIEDLEISSAPQFDEEKLIVTIKPIRVAREFTYNIMPSDLAKSLKHQPEVVVIADFKSSGDLYARLSREGSKVKIIEDRYSAERGGILFKHISEIENGFRRNYRSFYEIAELEHSVNKDKRRPDHFINFYSTTEMVNNQLLAQSSDEYFLAHIKGAVSDQEKIKARGSTRLDEMSLPISDKELKRFVSIRNAVMHFRIVTAEEAIFVLELSSRFRVYESGRILKSMNVLSKHSDKG